MNPLVIAAADIETEVFSFQYSEVKQSEHRTPNTEH